MNFFGLTHGRDCYCAPFFKEIAGDSSQCDAVCEGDTSIMCGGMSKSAIFEMHSCDDTAKNLEAASAAAKEVRTELSDVTATVEHLSKFMQGMADAFQPAFG